MPLKDICLWILLAVFSTAFGYFINHVYVQKSILFILYSIQSSIMLDVLVEPI